MTSISSSAPPQSSPPRLNRWIDSIARYGARGAAWARDFVADGHDDRVHRLQSMLGPLRSQQIESSRAVIDEAAQQILAIESSPVG